MRELLAELLKKESLADIPIMYIVRVLFAIEEIKDDKNGDLQP